MTGNRPDTDVEIFHYPLERRLTSFAGPVWGHWPFDAIAAEDSNTARGIVAVEMRRAGSSGTDDFRGNWNFSKFSRHDVINIDRNRMTSLRHNGCWRNGEQREQQKPQRR